MQKNIREIFHTQRQELFEHYKKGAIIPPRLLLEISRLTDQILSTLTQQYPLPEEVALCAVGGYGRQEMYPYSDIDLLLLLPDYPLTALAQTQLEHFITALWDLGLNIGHSVRTITECLREAEQDISIETSLLDLRWILGNSLLHETLKERFQKQLNPAKFFLNKKLELQQRYQRFNETPFAIEPNCKESPGGLRDIHFLSWISRAAGWHKNWIGLQAQGLMLAEEARKLQKVHYQFCRLRIGLHLLTGKAEDRLIYDLQPQLADAFELKAKHKRPSEILMRNYYWGARIIYTICHFMQQALQDYFFPNPDRQIQKINQHFYKQGDRLAIYNDNLFIENPNEIFNTFLLMSEHTDLRALSLNTSRALWKSGHRINHHFRNNPQNKAKFIQIFQQDRGIVHNLRRMVMLDVLPRYLPIFKKIVGQLQHDHYHIYTVDQHTLQVIRNLRRFTMEEHAQEDPFASSVMNDFNHHWILYLAALFHDIAKGRGGDHSELGAIDAQSFVNSHPISKEDGDLIVFLVKEHLKLSSTAQKRDLSDPDVIAQFASLMGSERYLSALYLLTVADIRGTSPNVMTQWKALQLNQLYTSALAFLGGKPQDRQTILHQRKTEAQTQIKLLGISDQARDQFWKKLDVAYFLRHNTDEITWHTRTLHTVKEPDRMVQARPLINALQVFVYTPDQKDLFVNICGYFYQNNIDILEAKIHTCPHGYALDSFLVTSPQIKEDARSCVAFIEKGLADQLSKPQNIQIKNRTTFGSKNRRLKTFPIVPHITLSPDEKNAHWRLDLSFINMPGVLYTMAYYFAKYEIDLTMAKAMSWGDRIEDIFILSGHALNHAPTQLLFKREVLSALNKLNPYITD